MRLAVFSYWLPVPGRKRGGIERLAHDLADGLARRGHEVTVWSYDPRPGRAAYAVRPLPCERFVTSWLGRRLTMGYLGNLLAVAPRYGDADAILTIGDSLLLPLLGKPVVRVMAGSALGEALSARSPLRFLHQLGVYAQELASAATQRNCVGISHGTRRYNPLVRHVIPLGSDLGAFFPDGACKSPEPSVLFVGALGGRKRGRLLVEWFTQHVRARHPDATLAVVGERGAAAAGVSYHVGVEDAELAAMYRRAWVYATPSTYEGFGLPYVEAMASGTPVIATPNAGSREVLGGGRFGELVEDERFGARLAELLSDRARREELAARGLERAEGYGLSKMIDRYEELIVSIRRGRAAESVAG
ncbi:MAG TPA: glycosyltransferase family 4 protein [Pyrinomonadaceae bacterium]